METVKKEMETLMEDMETVNKEMEIVKKEMETLMEDMENKNAALQRMVEEANPGQFVWKVEYLSKKIENAKRGLDTDIHSPVFFSSQCGYQMRLFIYPNGFGADEGSHLSVFFQIMKGKFDAVQKWPMKNSVKLAIVNQDNGDDFESWSCSHDSATKKCKKNFLRPQNKTNSAYGSLNFISHTTLEESAAALKNDTIFIRCCVIATP